MSKKPPKEQKTPGRKKAESNYELIRGVEARKRRRNLLAAAVIIILVVLVGIGAAIYLSNNAPVYVGGKAHDFSLKQITASSYPGQTITLSSKLGSVVLLEFMVSWCPNCQATAPTLAQVSQNYTSQGVFVLAVAEVWTGSAQEGTATAQTTQQYIQQYGSQYESYVLDETGGVAQAYGVAATPTFFVIDKAGTVTSVIAGAQTNPTLLSSAIWAALQR